MSVAVLPRMSRKPPPNWEERQAHIARNGFEPWQTKVIDTALNTPALFLGHTTAFMARIRYEDPEIIRVHGQFKLCNPTRLRLA